MSDMLYVKCRSCGSVNRFEEREGKTPLCGKCGTDLDLSGATTSTPFSVTDATFAAEVLDAKTPVVIDFYAEWCGACRSLEPALEAVASRFKGKVRVGKLDVDKNPETAGKYQIRATPTVIVFHDGKLAEQVVGAVPEQQLQEMVAKYA